MEAELFGDGRLVRLLGAAPGTAPSESVRSAANVRVRARARRRDLLADRPRHPP